MQPQTIMLIRATVCQRPRNYHCWPLAKTKRNSFSSLAILFEISVPRSKETKQQQEIKQLPLQRPRSLFSHFRIRNKNKEGRPVSKLCSTMRPMTHLQSYWRNKVQSWSSNRAWTRGPSTCARRRSLKWLNVSRVKKTLSFFKNRPRLKQALPASELNHTAEISW